MRIYIYKAGEVWGPFTVPQIEAMLNEERIHLSDLAALEQAEGWKPLGELVKVSTAGGSTTSTIRSGPASKLMDRINSLPPGDFIRSDTERAHFREVVPAFQAAGANRRGSREVTSPEGDPYIVDIYTLPDGREVLAGYMNPQEKARSEGLTCAAPGEDTEATVKRLIAMHLEVDGGILQVNLGDQLHGTKLSMDGLSAIELIMACEQEFGMKFEDEAVIATNRTDFTVADLVVMVKNRT